MANLDVNKREEPITRQQVAREESCISTSRANQVTAKASKGIGNSLTMNRAHTTPGKYKTGLINCSTPEEVQASIDRKKFVAELIAKNPDSVKWLREKTKDELIALIVEERFGFIPENLKFPPLSIATGLFASSQAYQTYLRGLTESFKNGTDVETRTAIDIWRKAAISVAGRNKELIAEIYGVAGVALDRINTSRYMAFKRNAQEGRANGAKTNKEKAGAHLSNLRNAAFDYFKSPVSSGKSDGEVADFLMSANLHRYPNGEYTKRTMTTRVKKLRAEYVGNKGAS